MRKVGMAAMVALALVSGACDDKADVTGNNAACANLTGNYTATTFTATSTGTPTVTNNFLSNGGAFVLGFNGTTFTSSYTASTGTAPVTYSGTPTATGTTITLGNQALFTGGATGTQSFTCSKSGNTLTLTKNGMNYLFPGTATAQPANVQIVLTKPAA